MHKWEGDAGMPYDRHTPLHLTAASGNLEIARFLVEKCGATLQRDRFGLLPINDAVENGHKEMRRFPQSHKLNETQVTKLKRVESEVGCGSHPELDQKEELLGAVFELVVKEGVFSYTTVHSEVQYCFKELGIHPIYVEHFAPYQVAKHVHSLVAAKGVACATDNMRRILFVFTSGKTIFSRQLIALIPQKLKYAQGIKLLSI